MDQSELYGRVIKVNQAKPQKAAGEKLGSKTAIWEQVSYGDGRGVCNAISHVANHETLFCTGRLRSQAQRQRRGQDGCRGGWEQGFGPDAGT
jgi:hypothetical protein